MSGAGDKGAVGTTTPPAQSAPTAPTTKAPGPALIAWSASEPILIAGGGIGGLATAIALARRGIPCRILERRHAFGEDGAGIQLGPNATRILDMIGVAPRLKPHVGRPRALRIRNGTTGRDIAALPLGDWLERRHGAPYWVAHRRDLHAALLDTALSLSPITIETDAGVTHIAPIHDGITAHLATGGQRTGRALVAADGVWSALRTAHFAAPQPAFAGKRAIRAVLPAAAVAIPDAASETGVWLRPDAHIVHYPVRDGSEIAVVGIFDEAEASRDWSRVVAPDGITRRTTAFAAPVRALFAEAVEWRAWALHRLDPLPAWTSGSVALLGDAAHPMLPFLAQGAVMALEDAVTLAACLARISAMSEIPSALANYAGLRQRRAARVQAASRDNGRIYHLHGAMARARDLTLRLAPPERIMARYDWLYGWRPMA